MLADLIHLLMSVVMLQIHCTMHLWNFAVIFYYIFLQSLKLAIVVLLILSQKVQRSDLSSGSEKIRRASTAFSQQARHEASITKSTSNHVYVVS